MYASSLSNIGTKADGCATGFYGILFTIQFNKGVRVMISLHRVVRPSLKSLLRSIELRAVSSLPNRSLIFILSTNTYLSISIVEIWQ